MRKQLGFGLLTGGGILLLASLFPSREKREEKHVDDFQKQAEEQGQVASYADLVYDGLAEAFHEAVGGFTFNDEHKAVEILSRMKNDLDIAKLIRAHGKRDYQTNVFGFGASSRSLQAAVQAEISPERLARVNEDYRFNGLKHRW